MTISRISAISILFCALFIASCANTVRGVSRDLQDTATAVDEAIN
jgi:predicted small secreted protein